jgi:putative transposase
MADDPKRSLTRLQRLYIRDPIYFVTCCTAGRAPILNNNQVHEAFRKFAAIGVQRDIYVGRYVLMPDHLHAFVRFGAGYSVGVRSLNSECSAVSSWMKSLKNALSKTLNERSFPAPHWQKGFFDHVLRSSESYHHKWLYVAENPVRHGLVSHREIWEFGGEICNLDSSRIGETL